MTFELGKPLSQPDLNQLFTQFMRSRTAVEDEGALVGLFDDGGEVLPYQASAVQTVDARTALLQAIEAASKLLDDKDAAGFNPRSMKAIPDWLALVRGQESQVAVAFCLGNFPQLVKDVTPLLVGAGPAELRAKAGRPLFLPKLAEWGNDMLAKGRLCEAGFAIGLMRLANQFDQAADLLARLRKVAPIGWRDMLLNEEAALAWHRGDCEQAYRLWNGHPAANQPAILFNRGLAALFTDRADEAIPLLTQAAEALSDRSAWHHLALLYLTLAQGA